MRHVVAAGAGQAGATVAAKLRALEFDGEITMSGDEPTPPYQRSPLSRADLLGMSALVAACGNKRRLIYPYQVGHDLGADAARPGHPSYLERPICASLPSIAGRAAGFDRALALAAE